MRRNLHTYCLVLVQLLWKCYSGFIENGRNAAHILSSQFSVISRKTSAFERRLWRYLAKTTRRGYKTSFYYL